MCIADETQNDPQNDPQAGGAHAEQKQINAEVSQGREEMREVVDKEIAENEQERQENEGGRQDQEDRRRGAEGGRQAAEEWQAVAEEHRRAMAEQREEQAQVTAEVRASLSEMREMARQNGGTRRLWLGYLTPELSARRLLRPEPRPLRRAGAGQAATLETQVRQRRHPVGRARRHQRQHAHHVPPGGRLAGQARGQRGVQGGSVVWGADRVVDGLLHGRVSSGCVSLR